MIIESISIKSFGMINDLTLDFSSGMNVIVGQNESGKSTIAAFIKYMLYGFGNESAPEEGSAEADEAVESTVKTDAELDTEVIAEFDTEEDEVEEEHDEDYQSEGLEWRALSRDACEVTGIGSCTDKRLVIPGVITHLWVKRIAPYAFDSEKLVSVVIPKEVTLIGEGAFGNCERLESVEMPDRLVTIENEAFIGCKKLKEASFGLQNLDAIGARAFKDCESLEYVNVPSRINHIGESAFENCSSLDTFIFRGESRLFDKVELGENWNLGMKTTVIKCDKGVRREV